MEGFETFYYCPNGILRFGYYVHLATALNANREQFNWLLRGSQ